MDHVTPAGCLDVVEDKIWPDEDPQFILMLQQDPEVIMEVLIVWTSWSYFEKYLLH